MTKYVTKEGLEKLKKELKRRKEKKRKEISDKTKEAADQGDLSENAAYDSAQKEYRLNEKRIEELRETINEAEVVEKKEGEGVQVGNFVHVKSEDGKEKYQIVGPEESDVFENKISFKSPLGKALMGKEEGDKATFDAAGEEKEYEILKIE